jgi:hypothetical protein
MDDFDDLAARVDLDDAIRSGVQRAIANWIDEENNWQRVEQCIEDGTYKAVTEWMDGESGKLRVLIANRLDVAREPDNPQVIDRRRRRDT